MPNEGYSLSIEFTALSQDIAYEIGLAYINALHEVLSGRRTGRWYPVPGNMFYDKLTPEEGRADNYWVKYTGAYSRSEIKGAAYQASAPGEPPAVRTGRLRQGFYMVVSAEQDYWKVSIRTTVKYADDLEFGTETIAPRPFANKAMRLAFPNILELQKKGIRKKILRGNI